MEDPGLGSQVSAAWPGRDGGGDPSGGRVRWLREGGGARAWTTLRTLLLVLCCGRGARAAAPAASGRHAPAPGSTGTWRVSGDTPRAAPPARDLGLQPEGILLSSFQPRLPPSLHPVLS